MSWKWSFTNLNCEKQISHRDLKNRSDERKVK